MHIVEIIRKKQKGNTLSKEEIDFFVNGYVSGNIPDYQIASLMMAIWYSGMDNRETTDLTLSMARSGDQIDLSGISGIKVDKHSTGGVADTTTLITGPVVAACGGTVAKMSGRGLGHTGGTLDKLESIPGFSVNQSMETFFSIVNSCGLSVIGQTGNLVPADKKMYALRDVTGTVDNISLIASSIMSKKIAAGADAIVLDVKVGNGAFMRDIESARELAGTMVDIGTMAGRKTVALITDMNQPLGYAIGNALEVREAVEILKGDSTSGRQEDLKKVASELAVQMLLLSQLYSGENETRSAVAAAFENGSALRKLQSMIELQGGDPSVCDDTAGLPQASRCVSVVSQSAGYLISIDTEHVGTAAQLLGAGRERKEDIIDPAVGIWMKKRLGDPVKPGEPLADFYINDDRNEEEAVNMFLKSCEIGEDRPEDNPLIYDCIS